MGLVSIKPLPHWIDAFMPNLVVKDKVTEPRMVLEVKSKKILHFTLVPIRRMHFGADAWNCGHLNRQLQCDFNPTGRRKKKHVVEMPMAGVLLCDNSAKGTAHIPEQEAAK